MSTAPALAGDLPGRILIVSDAWHPQVNGVVRTLSTVCEHLEREGCTVRVVGPDGFRSLPLPSYPEIRIALAGARRLGRLLDEWHAEALHIATEGPLGMAARRACLRRGLRFTTAFHTRFHDYVHARVRIPPPWTLRAMRWFHAPSARVLVATGSLEQELAGCGFTRLARWSRGVDAELFRPLGPRRLDLPRPVWLYVGRVAVEKNIEAFLELDLDGSKLVVGDGPQLESLRRAWPDVHFAGRKIGEELVMHIGEGDVMVFPSRTDTFGLVMLEALACGVPVAAFPVSGPLDVVTPEVGCLDEDLARAARAALERSPEACRRHALSFSWQQVAHRMRECLVPVA